MSDSNHSLFLHFRVVEWSWRPQILDTPLFVNPLFVSSVSLWQSKSDLRIKKTSEIYTHDVSLIRVDGQEHLVIGDPLVIMQQISSYYND